MRSGDSGASRGRSHRSRIANLPRWLTTACVDALQKVGCDSRALRITPLKLNLVIFFVYMAAVYLMDFKNAAYAPIKIDLGLSTTDISWVQSAQTMVLAFTKLLFGFFADYIGCRRSCIIAFFWGTVGLLVLSNANSFSAVLIGFTVIEGGLGIVWPSMTVLIRNWYRDNQQEREKSLWVVSLSSRFSGLTSLFFYSGLLNWLRNWRLVTLVAAFLPGALGLFLTVCFVRDGPTASEPKHEKRREWLNGKVHLRNFLSSKVFLFFVISHACNKIWRRADMLLGLFFIDATSYGEKDVPMLVTLQPIGLLVGILIAGPIYKSRSTHSSRLRMINQLYSVSIAALLVMSLASMCAQSLLKTLVLECAVFIASFGIAVQYYIVSGVFAIEFGQNAAGLCISLIDGLGHALSAIIFVPIGLIAESQLGWSGVWALLTILLLIGCALMNIFFREFYLHDRKYSRVSISQDL